MNHRSTARQLAQDSLARGDVTGWFETLYQHASGQVEAIPWADLRPNPNLLAWLDAQPADSLAGRALVVGCGLGDDAEQLAQRGLQVTAFDISNTAIDWCRQRFPGSPVDYQPADALQLPPRWQGQFQLVIEIYTLQVLPPEPRKIAMQQIAGAVAPDGKLLVIARGREPGDDPGSMPWPLTRDDLAGFQQLGLIEQSFEDFFDDEQPPVRRFRVLYRGAQSRDRYSSLRRN